MYIRILKPDFIFQDGRGELVQLAHEGYRQVNYILSHAGEERGGHYHRYNRELFYVISGKLELEVWPAHPGSVTCAECYTFGPGDMFEIPENVTHGFRFLEETSLISMYSRGVESASGEKDIIKGDGCHGKGREDLRGGA